MPIKSTKTKISKKKKSFFSCPKNYVPRSEDVTCIADAQKDRHTDEVTTVNTLSGFQGFSFYLSSRIGPKMNKPQPPSYSRRCESSTSRLTWTNLYFALISIIIPLNHLLIEVGLTFHSIYSL